MTRLLRLLHLGFAVTGGVALVLMLLVAVLDIVLRTLGAPLPGAFEIIGWLAAASMASALAYTQAHKGHISIRLVLARFPRRARLAMEAATALLAALLFGVAAWQLFLYAYDLQATGSLSETLRAPVYPWVYLVAAGVAALALTLVKDAVAALAALGFRESEGATGRGAGES